MAFGGTGFSLCDVSRQEIKTAQAEACATSAADWLLSNCLQALESFRSEVCENCGLEAPEKLKNCHSEACLLPRNLSFF